MNKMSLPSRIIIAVGSLALTATYFLPVWFIFLLAPQYPEGLTMNIWLDKITGQVEIINGLNHYIGMKPISADMFPEFDFLVYIVAGYIVLGLVVAIVGSRKLLFAYLVLTLLGAGAAMWDFYRWSYDYGHNLDPTAPIQVPGLTYQPPLFGHKQLLNFDAYSYPDIAGWIVIGVGAIFFGVWFYEWWKNRKKTSTTKRSKTGTTVAALCLFALASCSTEPEPFAYGKDICEECKMTIMDPKFGGEIITKKGKIYKFDDAHCMSAFLKKNVVDKGDISQTLFIDYEKENHFLDVNTAQFVVSPKLKSPMNSNAACFATEEAARKKAAETGGEIRKWQDLAAAN